ncbi:MAG TPA: hypothetical protein VLH09_00760 [Bryobacteraceae bacterium]|nr:hypothetical protein [Bryobacteraceae bacterium]
MVAYQSLHRSNKLPTMSKAPYGDALLRVWNSPRLLPSKKPAGEVLPLYLAGFW